MNPSVLEAFLTKDNIDEHLSHFRTQRLKYSILEKSIPEIKGKTVREIYRMRLKQEIKSEVLPCINSIVCHKIYFSSFCKNPAPCARIREFYISDDSFLYEILELGRRYDCGFILVGYGTHDKPYMTVYQDFSDYIPEGVVLALDLCEHAYFLDYRFEKERYLKAALARLDRGKLAEKKIWENYLDSFV